MISNHADDLPLLGGHPGWGAWIRGVTSSPELGVAKPDPRIFRRALERARVAPSEALHAGDSFACDVEGTRAVGMRAAWLHRGGRPSRDGVEELYDLRELLARRGTPR